MPRGRRKNQGNGDYQEPAPATHNSAERRQIMLEASDEIYRIEVQIKGLREKITEQKGRVKAIDMPMEEFLYAHKCRFLDDQAVRDRKRSAYDEAMEALMPGEQASFLMDGGATIKADPAPFDEGNFAALDNPEALNPYPPGTPEHADWQEGFMWDLKSEPNADGGGGVDAEAQDRVDSEAAGFRSIEVDEQPTKGD